MSYLRSMDDLVAGNPVAAYPGWTWSECEDPGGPDRRPTRRPRLMSFWTLDAASVRPVCTWVIAD